MKLSRLITAVLVLGMVTMAFAPSSRAQANETIAGGIDNLLTLPGTYDTITIPGGPTITVNLKGNPPCPACADTQIFRSAVMLPDVVGATATTNAFVGNLSLESVAPVNINGGFFNIFVTLDKTMPSTGNLVLTQTAVEGSPTTQEGTLTSSFTFTVDYSVVNVNGTVVATGSQLISGLTGTGIGWNDFDDGAPYFLSAAGGTECVPGVNCHVERPIPEPGTIELITLAAVGIGAFRRWVRL